MNRTAPQSESLSTAPIDHEDLVLPGRIVESALAVSDATDHAAPSGRTTAPPADRPARVLFIFLDGVGIGLPDPAINPLAHTALGLFPQLLAGPDSLEVIRRPLEDAPLHRIARLGHHAAIDACLDVKGTPQSATGQATLFTGVNGAAALGQHLTAFPNDPLAAIVRRENLLLKARRAGRRAAFLNTYTPRFFESGWPHSVSTLIALSLDQPLHMLEDMHAGRSLFHDITQEGLRAYMGEEIPVFTPAEAGARLAGAAKRWDISLYEHFWTDRVGHKGDLELGIAQAVKVEAFLHAVLEATDLEETLVVVGTDHGNLEESRHRGHTRNPVPLSAWGPGAAWLTASVRSLTDVTPALLELLGIAA
jgi:hypothetical protein